MEFQSPQWGSNSKEAPSSPEKVFLLFQSPQWGSNSKGNVLTKGLRLSSFSPRNGEVILKKTNSSGFCVRRSFSPRNGEVILK